MQMHKKLAKKQSDPIIYQWAFHNNSNHYDISNEYFFEFDQYPTTTKNYSIPIKDNDIDGYLAKDLE